MFVFIKKIFYIGSLFLSSLVSTTSLNCISMKNQECKVRPEIINVNSNNPIFYPFSIKINKCSGNCNNINDPYARICVPDIVKNLNVKVFNLITRTNETKFIEWHEKCKCLCRLDKIICNNKQKWNKDKCRYDCKKLIDKGVCNKGYTWNPSNCECECDKACDVGKYLDYSDCKCKKQLANKLIDECTETIEEAKLVNVTFTGNENNYEHNSCKAYIVLMTIAFTIFTGITVYLIYYNWSLINNDIHCIKFNNHKIFNNSASKFLRSIISL